MANQSKELTWFETSDNPLQKKTRGSVLFGGFQKDGSEKAEGGFDAIKKISLSKKEAQKRLEVESKKDTSAEQRRKKLEEAIALRRKKAFILQLTSKFNSKRKPQGI